MAYYMLDTMLWALPAFHTKRVRTWLLSLPVSQMRKVGFREVNLLTLARVCPAPSLTLTTRPAALSKEQSTFLNLANTKSNHFGRRETVELGRKGMVTMD